METFRVYKGLSSGWHFKIVIPEGAMKALYLVIAGKQNAWSAVIYHSGCPAVRWDKKRPEMWASSNEKVAVEMWKACVVCTPTRAAYEHMRQFNVCKLTLAILSDSH